MPASLTSPFLSFVMEKFLVISIQVMDFMKGVSSPPHFFVITMDIFCFLLEKEVEKGNFIPLASSSCCVSHILFAYDILVFEESSE